MCRPAVAIPGSIASGRRVGIAESDRRPFLLEWPNVVQELSGYALESDLRSCIAWRPV